MGGISVYGYDNLIGTNGDGIADEDERNIISANSSNQNSGSGINISGNSNTVAGNYIGTDATGNSGLGNYQEGISLVNGANGNLIGTDSDGQSDLIERNLISGNGRAGIGLFSASSNIIAGNFIGTDVTGTSAIPMATTIAPGSQLSILQPTPTKILLVPMVTARMMMQKGISSVVTVIQE